MRGVAYDPALRAKLMALHQQGVTLKELSHQSGIARPILSRWWARYRDGDWEALQPYSRRPLHSPKRIRLGTGSHRSRGRSRARYRSTHSGSLWTKSFAPALSSSCQTL